MPRKNLSRRLQAGWRDTLLLLKEFSWSLFLFCLVVVGGGLFYYYLGAKTGEPLESIPEAIYLVLGLIFLQPTIDFPHDWHLQAFFFLLPILGLSVIAQGVAEFSTLFFNRRARSKEWEVAVASTFNHHVIIVGLGHLGYQTLKNLLNLGLEVVAIELNPDAELISEVQALGVPVLSGDANKQTALENAGIQKAQSIILCTQNDPLNMQIAIKAKALNPNLKVVTRIFDEQFAKAIEDQFDFTALSSSVMSAPRFAAAAAGMEMTRPISIEGENYSLVRFNVSPKSKLVGITAEKLEQDYNVSLVMIKRQQTTQTHPPADSRIQQADCIVILAAPDQIRKVMAANE